MLQIQKKISLKYLIYLYIY
ncbi:hypothetical protein PFFCH_01299 [Plasmodium falciparum FCH/4]|uniref:Uncharacterized protein n=1 Tax=Plasmodium falciparum FCH/4 TaxID=1036724 RepID=A0A024VR95_PLAFA|nr:hypothetical protein PFFCH_01299 [Plasmodium falciparum FCH/4]